MEATEGKEWLAQVDRHDGAEQVVRDEQRADGIPAKHAPRHGDEVRVALGRTISMGNFEFTRVTLGMTAALPVSDQAVTDAEALYQEIRAYLSEHLDREEAALRRVKRADVPVDEPAGIGRSIWVEYGMTIQGASRFDSHKFDVGCSRLVDDGASVNPILVKLTDEVGVRLLAERDRLVALRQQDDNG